MWKRCLTFCCRHGRSLTISDAMQVLLFEGSASSSWGRAVPGDSDLPQEVAAPSGHRAGECAGGAYEPPFGYGLQSVLWQGEAACQLTPCIALAG